jgi:hypothetical protein
MKVIYDRERDGFLERMRKTYVKRTLFQLSDMENARSVIEDIAKREEENEIKAVEWYKDIPAMLDDIEYNAALVKVGYAIDITPNKEEDKKVLRALKETPGNKIGKNFGVKIDVVAPFTHKSFLCYSPK